MVINEKDYQYKELNIGALLFCNPFPKNSRTGSTATCMLCARTSTLTYLKGFNSNLRRYEDLDLTIRALKNNISLLCPDQCSEIINGTFKIIDKK